MAKHYGFKVWDVGELTLRQLNAYMDNLNYVMEWSEEFGKPPIETYEDNTLVWFAVRCGIKVPIVIRRELAGD